MLRFSSTKPSTGRSTAPSMPGAPPQRKARVREMPLFMQQESAASSQEGNFLNESITSAYEDSREYDKAITGLQLKKAVQYSRIAILAVLAFCTIGVACFVYRYTDQDEIRHFEQQFEEDSRKVLEAVASNLDFTLGVVDSFSVDQVNLAEASNQTFPFVTTKRFAVRAAKLKSLTNAMVVSDYPLVREADRAEWEAYSVANDAWVDEGLRVQLEDQNYEGTQRENWTSFGQIHTSQGVHPGPGLYFSGPYFPTWQAYPIGREYPPYNWDIGTQYPDEVHSVMAHKGALLGTTLNLPLHGEPFDPAALQWIKGFGGESEDHTEPVLVIYYPILSRTEEEITVKSSGDNDVVGLLLLTFFWKQLIRSALPPGSDGITVVIGNSCDQAFTYTIQGPNVTYVGGGDQHEMKYDDHVKRSLFTELCEFAVKDRTLTQRQYTGLDISDAFCPYWIEVYPSDELLSAHTSSDPIVFTVIAVSIFLFTSAVFLVYDYLIRARQRRILRSALRNSAVVSSLFPTSFRDKVLDRLGARKTGNHEDQGQGRLSSFLRQPLNASARSEAPCDDASPIAQYFEETTIMIADIVNFTAWVSVREPGQVFTLLENIYRAFDQSAKRRGAYKVENIGDSYVAVCGLPDLRSDHAVVMVRFAWDCRQIMCQITRDLEIKLGPGTADLQMRFGLNSGPVIAGVLRGDRSRFQLFGDTVNTAACMENTGTANKVHVSQSTADLLVSAGKQHWVTRRKETVNAKGKGMIQTFWVERECFDASRGGAESSDSSSDDDEEALLAEKMARLEAWNVEVLGRLLADVMANRDVITPRRRNYTCHKFTTADSSILDEVSDWIDFSSTPSGPTWVVDSTNALPAAVATQLRSFVQSCVSLYQKHPYHNFEHACHVAMTLVKSIGRIASPGEGESADSASGCVRGCDPVAKFALVFSALVHNIGHPGVINSQLVSENSILAKAYEGRSVAEQNSIDVAWELLNHDSLGDLRMAICATQGEIRRFRQLVVNFVMATDPLDKVAREARDGRWALAFNEQAAGATIGEVAKSRRCTLLGEHLMQAANIAHTMQHWHIYRKWSERFFEELYIAYQSGRGDANPLGVPSNVNPADYWYADELAFLENCAIPLATKLRDSRMFGASSEELLNYAKRNRDEWKLKGQEVVASMTNRFSSRRKKMNPLDNLYDE